MRWFASIPGGSVANHTAPMAPERMWRTPTTGGGARLSQPWPDKDGGLGHRISGLEARVHLMVGSRNDIETQLSEQAGVYAAVEETATEVVLSGLISSEEQRRAAIDIVSAIAPSKRIIDNLEVVDVLPEALGNLHVSTSSEGSFAGATPGTSDREGLEPGDFSDQVIHHDTLGAAGPSGFTNDEDSSEGEEVYVPPTDPVLTREGKILGGFEFSADDSVSVETSTLGARLSDGSIAEAIRRELREDAATTDLEIHVSVERGVAELRGSVASLDDAENAEAVARRVPGVVEVKENLEVRNLS
jgi:osmotically-inducible protein OsmY